MSWFVSIKDWLHSNYLDKLYDTSIAEITEEIFGLFLLLQMIEDESIELEELKLYHEWPRLHNETEWLNYKVVMPENVNKISNQSNNFFEFKMSEFDTCLNTINKLYKEGFRQFFYTHSQNNNFSPITYYSISEIKQIIQSMPSDINGIILYK
jgi:hypothetical protein